MIDQIINTDCLLGLRKLPSESVDLTITSPPYDDLREYNGNIEQWSFNKFQEIAKELFRVTVSGGVIVWIVNDMTVNGSETGTSFRQALYFKEIGFCLHDTMIWNKISPFQHKNRYIPSFEYMFVFSRGAPKTANLIRDRKNKWGGTSIHGTERQRNGKTKPLSDVQKSKTVKDFGARYNIWDIPPVKNNKTGHPATFPQQLVRDHIISWSNIGDTVLDPFMGSGTTALAAIETGRHYIGFEIDTAYYDICQERVIQAKEERRKNLFFLLGDDDDADIYS